MSAPPPATPPVPSAERGATHIADRVVAKIAAQAAREALAREPGAQPRSAGRAHPAAPHATVTVHHDVARVRISLELGYPSDLGAQCAAVRSRVVRRIEECAGMSVPEVDIDIEHLHPPGTSGAALHRKPR
ncbi:hypothetical protein ACIO7M_29750 [Streptomyces toxytricini]|uniref:Asp23/Gls24 family envelope stress response protein n=1 Tax=Streptomyces toxytricini TaxID=67369 RepID=A0ABW8ERM1_STRT5